MEISDEDILLWLKTPGQQERGFRVLVQKYSERLYWHIRKVVVTHEDANDVLQNTFMKTFKGISKYKGNAALYTWLYRIATNESLTHLDKVKRQKTVDIDNAAYGLDNRLRAESYYEGSRIRDTLQLAIAALPEKQRIVFNMRYFDNMKYEDISQVLETSVGALKASYHHAKNKIEDYIRQRAT